MSSRAEHMKTLNECLDKFQATVVGDITEKYQYFPSYAESRLGSGSYGEAFRMRSSINDKEPLRVVKVIPKARVTNSAHQIQHLSAELAVTGLMQHEYLNRRVGLLHSSTHIYIVLELCEGSVPDVTTRVAHIFAMYHPRRIAQVDEIIGQWTREAAEAGVGLEEYAESKGKFRQLLAECGAKREAPVGTDLFGLICALKRVPDAMGRIIIKQAMEALRFMHQNNVVHRDVKTENLVVAIDRKAVLLREETPEGTKVVGVRVEEKVSCRLIDFGLVKYMRLGAAPTATGGGAIPNVFSPGAYLRAAEPSPGAPSQQAAGSAAGGGGGFDAEADPMALLMQLEGGNAGGNTASAATGGQIPLAVTPCGTELYCSLEVINGILASGMGRTKWESSRFELPKMDVYGAGTMLFCMANGRPPFRPPRDQYRQVSREDRIRQVQRLVAAGPVFSAGVADETQEYVKLLMTNDPKARPDSNQALLHEYLAKAGDTFRYEMRCDGTMTVLAAEKPVVAVAPVAAAQEDEEEYEEDDVLGEVVRHMEDDGDAGGKDTAQKDE